MPFTEKVFFAELKLRSWVLNNVDTLSSVYWASAGHIVFLIAESEVQNTDRYEAQIMDKHNCSLSRILSHTKRNLVNLIYA